MPARTIDGPEGEWLDADKAAAWLGISSPTFRRLVREFDWIHPRKLKGCTRWHWLDLVCLSRILQCSPKKILEESAEEAIREKSSRKSTGSGTIRSDQG